MKFEVAILTPEKVAISYRVARVMSRGIAHLLDIFVWMAFIYVIGNFVNLFGPVFQPILWLASFLSFFLYFILFEGLWNGYTPGKFALGIRVRMADGTPITLAAAFYRNLFRTIDIFPGCYFAGMVMTFLTEKSQRLGDIVANTMVTHERIPVPNFAPAPHKFGDHPFESHVGTLRKMTLAEYQAIKRLADRYPELPTHIQNRLTAEVWEPFAEKHRIEPIEGVHPVYLMEAAVMKYARLHDLV